MSNTILADMLPTGSRERLRPPQPLDLMPWMSHARFTIDGNVFTLDRAPWMRTIVEDDSRELVFEKGSQVGVSSFSLAYVLRGADQLGQRWIYFLPTDDETDDFVADRVEKTLRESDYLNGRIGNTDNRGLKHLGPGLIYFRGLWTKRRAKSVPADGLVFDEIDEHKPENVIFAADRILASRDPRKLYLSVPSFSAYGIDAMFRDSDQRYLMHHCAACGKWNSLDEEWPANFLPIARNREKSAPEGATHYRGCRYCDAELDISAGEWVAKNPGNRVHGYRISRLYALNCPPDYPDPATFLMDEWRKAQGDQEKLQRFTIAFRAHPFDGEGARITEELLLSLEGGFGFLYRASGAVMGIDQGNKIHVSIYAPDRSEHLRLIYCEVTLDWDRCGELFRRFGCYVAGVDRGPDVHSARGFAHAFNGRVYLISYGNDEVESIEGEPIKRRVKDDLHKGKFKVPWVTVDRTNSLDATVELVDSGAMALPDRKELTGEDLRRYDEWRFNVANLKWRFEDTPTGRRRIYIKCENHHGMGLNYARIAAFELGIKPPAPQVMPVFREWGHA